MKYGTLNPGTVHTEYASGLYINLLLIQLNCFKMRNCHLKLICNKLKICSSSYFQNLHTISRTLTLSSMEKWHERKLVKKFLLYNETSGKNFTLWFWKYTFTRTNLFIHLVYNGIGNHRQCRWLIKIYCCNILKYITYIFDDESPVFVFQFLSPRILE